MLFLRRMRVYLQELVKGLIPGQPHRISKDRDSLIADLHVHSLYSPDSISPLEEIIDNAINNEVDVIAITDHFVDKAFVLLSEDGRELLGPEYNIEKGDTFLVIKRHGRKLVLVKGKEVSTEGGYHILALAYLGQIFNFQSVKDTLEQIRENKGIAIIAHPCNTLSHGIGASFLRKLAEQENTQNLIDAVEVFNANSFFPMFWNNLQAQRLAKKLGLAEVAGSDAHQVRHLGRAVTAFQGTLDVNSPASFVSSFKEIIHTSKRDHIKQYVPLTEFFDWFFRPKFSAMVRGKPVRIQPPPDYEYY